MNSASEYKMSRRDALKVIGAGGVVTAGCAPGLVNQDPNPKMQNYLDYGFIRYPEELGKQCDYRWEKKQPVEYISALSRQLCAMGNDILELPFEITARFADDLGYALLGGKAKGELNKYILHGFVKSAFDSIPGGKGNDEIVDRIVRLDFDSAFDYARRVEDTELGANMKMGSVGFFNFLQIDAALKAAFGGKSLLEKMFGFSFHKGGDGAAAVTHKADPAPGM